MLENERTYWGVFYSCYIGSGREQVLRSTGFSSTIQNWLTSTVRRSRFW